jgi:uncharacterized protein (TIGR03435 family)
MTRITVIAPFLALFVTYCPGQDLTSKPAFEVASITPCPPGTPAPGGEHNGMAHFTSPGGRFTARATSIKFLLEWAFGILPSQHSPGPSWLGEDRYDIVAKAPGKASDEEMQLMTQALLADRFQLKFHRETREAPVLILSAGKTPFKLFPPKPEEKQSITITPRTGEDQKVFSYHVAATRFSFAQLNLTFARVLDHVIVNRTGLEGDFDFTLDLTPDENRPNPLDPSLIITAMREQLGLTVKSDKAAVEFLVIDRIEKVAAGN